MPVKVSSGRRRHSQRPSRRWGGGRGRGQRGRGRSGAAAAAAAAEC